MTKRTEDFEQVICDCGKYCECLDKPEYPESGDVWQCSNCGKTYCGV